jgi:hypothetical protein
LSVHACSFIDRPPSSPQTRRLLQCALRPSSCSSSSSWPRPSAPFSPPSLPAHARLFPPSVRGVPPGWLAGRPDGRARACVVTLTALPSFPCTVIARRAAAPSPTPLAAAGAERAMADLPPSSALSDAADGGRRRVRARPSPSECVLACLPACLFALSVYVSICLPVCLPACLLACLSVCLSVCLA